MSEDQLIKTPCLFGENGNFLLEREMGRGGMGGVYMGRDKMLDRPVAVKVMLREYGSDPEFVEKFKREAQAAARLIHPNIAQIYSYGISDGMPYIAMELVAGGSLDQLMSNSGGKTDIPRVMKICEQVAQALRCAADQGLVHGDVKPENVLLDANGNAKLVDFGLAAMQKDTNEIWGTPYYIAPEKVKKEGVDYRADMYSLGGTIYHALCGVAPFEGDNAVAVVRKRFEGAPKKPSEVRPGISPQIDFLVMKMLAMNPSDRYPSFEALLADFKKVMTTGLGTDSARKGATARLGATSRLTSSFKRPGLTGQTGKIDDEAGDAADGKTGRFKVKKFGDAGDASDSDVPEEEKDNIGAKVAMVVGGVILAIGLIVGGLVWYQVSARNAEIAEKQAQIAAGFGQVRTSFDGTRASAQKFATEISEFSENAVKDCEKFTTELEGVLSKYFVPSVVEQRKSVSSAAPAADGAAVPAQQGGGPTRDESGKRTDTPAVVGEVRGLWEQANICREASGRVCKQIEELVADIDKAIAGANADIGSMEDLDRAIEALRGLETAANELDARHKDIRGGADVAAISKAKGIITSRSQRVLDQTIKRLNEDEMQYQRGLAKKAREDEERKRQERLAQEKEQKIESDRAAAKEAFDSVIASGKIRQLDWKGAYRTLDAVEPQTAEGEIALKAQRDKIHCMELVQTVLVRSLKDYTFTRPSKNPKENLKGAVVQAVDDSKITLLKKGEQKPVTIAWQTFFKNHPNSLAEIIAKFIEKSGSAPGSKRLSAMEYFDSMIGVAFLMRHVCSENSNPAAAASAAAYGDKLVIDAVKKYSDNPERVNKAKECFPDIDFESAMQDAAAENL